IVLSTEVLNQLLRVFICLIGYFLAKLIPLVKHFACNMDDFFSVGIIFSKNQGFGNMLTSLEHYRKEVVFVATEYRSNLSFGKRFAVKFFRCVLKIFV